MNPEVIVGTLKSDFESFKTLKLFVDNKLDNGFDGEITELNQQLQALKSDLDELYSAVKCQDHRPEPETLRLLIDVIESVYEPRSEYKSAEWENVASEAGRIFSFHQGMEFRQIQAMKSPEDRKRLVSLNIFFPSTILATIIACKDCGTEFCDACTFCVEMLEEEAEHPDEQIYACMNMLDLLGALHVIPKRLGATEEAQYTKYFIL